MNSGQFLLLAALGGPALAGPPPSPAQMGPSGAAARFAPFIEAHRSASAGGGLLPALRPPASGARVDRSPSAVRRDDPRPVATIGACAHSAERIPSGETQ